MPRSRTRTLSNRVHAPQGAPTIPPHVVLLVEQRRHDADPLAAQLQENGLQVALCRDDTTGLACVETGGGRCPLDDPTALVVDVRATRAGGMGDGELGVLCAERAGIPIVAVGTSRPSLTDAPWASSTCDLGDALDLCRQLIGGPIPLQDLGVEHTVRRLLSLRGEDVGEVAITVTHWDHRSVVAVQSTRLPSPAASAALERALGGHYAVVYQRG